MFLRDTPVARSSTMVRHVDLRVAEALRVPITRFERVGYHHSRRERMEGLMASRLMSKARSMRGATMIAGALAALCCNMPASAQTTDQLHAGARAEQKLVLWAAGPTAAYERAARVFEQKFPGLAVALTGGFSNVLNAKIEEQIGGKKVETDVVIFQTVQDLVNWNRRGLLLHFKPEAFDKIAAGSKDKDGAWIAVNTNPIFYGYNTEQVRAEDVPKSAPDFLKAQFKGRLISAYPADDDATLYAFHTIVEKYGWSYMDRYMAQQPKFVQGHLGVARSLGSGESLVSLDNTVSSTLNVQRAGGKLALAAPASDPVPIFFTAEAILKDAPHPNAAKLFVSWFLSKEWQSGTGVYSSRSDMAAPAGLEPLSKYQLAAGYLQFVTNEQQLTELRKRFEGYTGPVTNRGGVQ
jgi:ABC-type Fe3+ transport system substrate-binding protein